MSARGKAHGKSVEISTKSIPYQEDKTEVREEEWCSHSCRRCQKGLTPGFLCHSVDFPKLGEEIPGQKATRPVQKPVAQVLELVERQGWRDVP